MASHTVRVATWAAWTGSAYSLIYYHHLLQKEIVVKQEEGAKERSLLRKEIAAKQEEGARKRTLATLYVPLAYKNAEIWYGPSLQNNKDINKSHYLDGTLRELRGKYPLE